jgi:FkbM family methyltransferase
VCSSDLLQIRGHSFCPLRVEAPVLVDLGANVGRFAAEFLAAHPAARAGLIEGDPYLVGLLQQRFGDDPRVQIVPALVGARSEPEVAFHLCKIPEGNSVFREFSSTWSPTETREVRVRMLSLPDVLSTLGLEYVHLLKVDIEGSEWELLEAFAPELSARVEQLTVEFHDFLDPGRRPDTERCIRHLQDLGYATVCRGTNHGHGSPYFDCQFARP